MGRLLLGCLFFLPVFATGQGIPAMTILEGNESGTEWRQINRIVGNCDNCDEKWHELGYGRRLILFDDNTYCHANVYPGAYRLGIPYAEGGDGWSCQLIGGTMMLQKKPQLEFLSKIIFNFMTQSKKKFFQIYLKSFVSYIPKKT